MFHGDAFGGVKQLSHVLPLTHHIWRWRMDCRGQSGGRAGNMHQVTSVIYVCSLAVHEDKGVDDPGEVTCFAGSNKGSNSEVQSLSSFQSDSGDDNGKKSWACSPRAGSASCQWLRGR